MFAKCMVTMLVVLAAGAAAGADGPLEKGSFMLDGSFFFQSQSGDLWENGDGDAMTSYGIGNSRLSLTGSYEVAPTFGFFVSPGLMLGAQVAFVGYSSGDNKLSALAIGPSVIYYVNTDQSRIDAKGAVYPFFGAFFSYGSLSDEDEKIADLLQFGGRAGMLYMISDAVGADFTVRVQSDSWKYNGAPERISGMTFRLGVGIAAFIF